MAHAAVAAQVHQALDVHRRFTAQIALDGELVDFVTQLFQIRVSQILDLLVGRNAGNLANLPSARAADTVDSSQADHGMLMVGDIDPCDTCHSSILFAKLALALLMTRVRRADHTHHALALDDFAVAANALNRSQHFHDFPLPSIPVRSLRPEYDARAGQIIRGQFDRHLVPGQDANVMHAHLAGNMAQHYMAVFQFDAERCVGEVFQHLTLHLDRVIFGHVSSASCDHPYRSVKLPLKFAFFIKDSYC